MVVTIEYTPLWSIAEAADLFGLNDWGRKALARKVDELGIVTKPIRRQGGARGLDRDDMARLAAEFGREIRWAGEETTAAS